MKRFVLLLLLVGLAPNVAAQRKPRKPKPTCGVTKIADCPREGCGSDAEMNKRKNLTTRPTAGDIQLYQRVNFTSLKFPKKWKSGAARGLLKDWGEGTPVEYEAYLVTVKNYPSGTESTNCNLKKDVNNDWHLVL